MEESVGLRWRKSSYSGNGGGNCVEVASNLPDGVAVRDSKNPDGPRLATPGVHGQSSLSASSKASSTCNSRMP